MYMLGSQLISNSISYGLKIFKQKFASVEIIKHIKILLLMTQKIGTFQKTTIEDPDNEVLQHRKIHLFSYKHF